jgi:hypothetical protein
MQIPFSNSELLGGGAVAFLLLQKVKEIITAARTKSNGNGNGKLPSCAAVCGREFQSVNQGFVFIRDEHKQILQSIRDQTTTLGTAMKEATDILKERTVLFEREINALETLSRMVHDIDFKSKNMSVGRS